MKAHPAPGSSHPQGDGVCFDSSRWELTQEAEHLPPPKWNCAGSPADVSSLLGAGGAGYGSPSKEKTPSCLPVQSQKQLGSPVLRCPPSPLGVPLASEPGSGKGQEITWKPPPRPPLGHAC